MNALLGEAPLLLLEFERPEKGTERKIGSLLMLLLAPTKQITIVAFQPPQLAQG